VRVSDAELRAALRVVLPEILREVLPTLLAQTAANNPPNLLGVDQAAEHLGLGVSTIRKLAGRCEVASVKSGRRLLFRPEDLDAYAKARRRSPERVRALAERAAMKEQEG
jgi:excisionase family DNA binding protein